MNFQINSKKLGQVCSFLDLIRQQEPKHAADADVMVGAPVSAALSMVLSTYSLEDLEITEDTYYDLCADIVEEFISERVAPLFFAKKRCAKYDEQEEVVFNHVLRQADDKAMYPIIKVLSKKDGRELGELSPMSAIRMEHVWSILKGAIYEHKGTNVIWCYAKETSE